MILILSLGSNFTNATMDSVFIERMDFRIDKIEENQTIEKDKFEVYKEQVDLKLAKYEGDYDWLFWIFAGSFGFVTIAGLVLWLISLPKKINKIAEEKANEKLSSYFEEKKSKIQAIVKNSDEDEKMKREKKIIVVSKKDSDFSFLNQFLKKYDFKATFIEVETYSEITEDYDILLLNNEKDEFKTSFEDYFNDLKPNTLLFCFGKFLKTSNEEVYFSSATFRSQLYGNLMSALRYQKFMD